MDSEKYLADLSAIANETAKRCGLKADPSWDGEVAYWLGRMENRIQELEALLTRVSDHAATAAGDPLIDEIRAALKR